MRTGKNRFSAIAIPTSSTVLMMVKWGPQFVPWRQTRGPKLVGCEANFSGESSVSHREKCRHQILGFLKVITTMASGYDSECAFCAFVYTVDVVR